MEVYLGPECYALLVIPPEVWNGFKGLSDPLAMIANSKLADEEILRRIQHIPRERPVVVASSDREVTEGARRIGANAISSEQLLAIL